MLKLYAEREIENRKIFLINNFISKYNRIVDLGCGNGEYIQYLQMKAMYVIGVDINMDLVKISKAKGFEVVLASLDYLPFKYKSFDCAWASEVVEHFPTLDILDKIEYITSNKMIITMPNPIFPHFKRDPTHILLYSVSSIRNFLDKRSKKSEWIYLIRGLGFNEMIPTKIIKMFTVFATWFFPWFSPTILVIATNNDNDMDVSLDK